MNTRMNIPRAVNARSITAALVLISLTACGGNNSAANLTPTVTAPPTSKDTPSQKLNQSSFSSQSAFKTYYAEALAAEYFTGYTYNRNCFGCEPAILVDVASGDSAEGSLSPSTPSTDRQVTETNTQEVGVDEADLIETNPNGTEIYVLRRFTRELLVIETADPANLQVLSRQVLSGNREPVGMFFDAQTQTLTVILHQNYLYYFGAPGVSDAVAVGAPQATITVAPGSEFEEGTQVQFFDVSTPSQPTLIEDFVTDGQYVDARRIGSRVHVITQFGFPYATALYNDEAFRKLAYEDYPQAYYDQNQVEMDRLEPLIRQHIAEAVAVMPIADLLPQQSTLTTGVQTLSVDQILRPDVSTRLGLLMISSLNTDGSALNTLGTINNSWQIYASTDSLYVLQNSAGWWFDPAQRQQTAIYRFDLSTGSALPGAVGVVDGWANNSYQFSEFGAHLRAATTEGRYASDGGRFSQHNHLSVLNKDTLNLSGAVKDFVDDKQESIRAVRFLGDRGFVVTFRFTDPLFAFDLSDPSNPLLKGSLTIPGFSTYIHPLGENHLLTIGRSGGPDGLGTGNSYQLRIFDVSDLANPLAIAEETPVLGDNDYAFSLAENDPHAFTFADQSTLLSTAPEGLLSIPVQIGSPDTNTALSGFVAYRIRVADGANAISEYARIDHKDSPDQNNGGSTCPDDRTPPDGGCTFFAPVIYNEPLRSVIISETGLVNTTTLLTLSSAKIKSLDASGAIPQENSSLDLDAPTP